MSAYTRSASEPRERDRRSYQREPRERGGTSFWNPNVPRNIDADSWRRDPTDHPISRGPPPRTDRDRSRGRMERPPSRGSTGEHRRDYNGSARYSTYRGRGRGRRGDGTVGDMNGRGQPYRGNFPRYGGSSSGQGTQYFHPLVSHRPNTTKFNANEALDLFSKRWQSVSNELNDKSLLTEQRPTVYKADTSATSVWGQPKAHVHSGITDFLSELKSALERDEKSQTEPDTELSQQSET